MLLLLLLFVRRLYEKKGCFGDGSGDDFFVVVVDFGHKRKTLQKNGSLVVVCFSVVTVVVNFTQSHTAPPELSFF